jgi:hypothetical protein
MPPFVFGGGKHSDRRGKIAADFEFSERSLWTKSPRRIRQTVGLLQRLHVYIDYIKYISKESNSHAGLTHPEQSVYTEYPAPASDEWTMVILPLLRKVPVPELENESG